MDIQIAKDVHVAAMLVYFSYPSVLCYLYDQKWKGYFITSATSLALVDVLKLHMSVGVCV